MTNLNLSSLRFEPWSSALSVKSPNHLASRVLEYFTCIDGRIDCIVLIFSSNMRTQLTSDYFHVGVDSFSKIVKKKKKNDLNNLVIFRILFS